MRFTGIFNLDASILKELFAGFVRSRHVARHFRRFIGFGAWKRANISREAPPALTQTLLTAAQSNAAAVLDSLGTSMAGLNNEQLAAARELAGPNKIGHEQPLSWRVCGIAT